MAFPAAGPFSYVLERCDASNFAAGVTEVSTATAAATPSTSVIADSTTAWTVAAPAPGSEPYYRVSLCLNSDCSDRFVSGTAQPARFVSNGPIGVFEPASKLGSKAAVSGERGGAGWACGPPRAGQSRAVLRLLASAAMLCLKPNTLAHTTEPNHYSSSSLRPPCCHRSPLRTPALARPAWSEPLCIWDHPLLPCRCGWRSTCRPPPPCSWAPPRCPPCQARTGDCAAALRCACCALLAAAGGRMAGIREGHS